MWPDRVSNPGLLTYESGALPTALCGPAVCIEKDMTSALLQQTCCTLFFSLVAPVAQWVKRWPTDLVVPGSSPE